MKGHIVQKTSPHTRKTLPSNRLDISRIVLAPETSAYILRWAELRSIGQRPGRAGFLFTARG